MTPWTLLRVLHPRSPAIRFAVVPRAVRVGAHCFFRFHSLPRCRAGSVSRTPAGFLFCVRHIIRSLTVVIISSESVTASDSFLVRAFFLGCCGEGSFFLPEHLAWACYLPGEGRPSCSPCPCSSSVLPDCRACP